MTGVQTCALPIYPISYASKLKGSLPCREFISMQRNNAKKSCSCKGLMLMQDIHAHAENMKGEIKVDQEKGPFSRNLQAVGLPVSKRSSFYFFSQCFCRTLLSSLAAFQPGSSPFFSFPFHLLELLDEDTATPKRESVEEALLAPAEDSTDVLLATLGPLLFCSSNEGSEE